MSDSSFLILVVILASFSGFALQRLLDLWVGRLRQ